MIEILEAATRQVVHHPDSEALVKKEIDHVTPDETGATRDNSDVVQRRPTCLSVRTLWKRSSSIAIGSRPSWNAWQMSLMASLRVRRGRHPSLSAIFLDDTWYDLRSSLGV